MTPQTQTIELLKLLGDETAEVVLAHLDPDQAAELRAGLLDSESSDLELDEQRDLLDQFGRFLNFAGASDRFGDLEIVPGTTGTRRYAVSPDGTTVPIAPGEPLPPGTTLVEIPEETPLAPDGTPLATVPQTGQPVVPGQPVAPGTPGAPVVAGQPGSPTVTADGTVVDEHGDIIEAPLEATVDGAATSETGETDTEETVDIAMKLTGDPLEDLASLNIYQVAGALETEQPRTVAILLSEFPFQLTADVLSLLPPEHQAAVVRELAHEFEAPRVLVDRIARATLQRGLTLAPEEPDRRDRLDRLSDVLRAVPKKLRRNMMTGIEEEDQQMSQELLKKLYRFEDLTSLDPRVIQQVLGEVDGSMLTTAMFQAPDEVVDAILGNLSKRARQSIEEELAFQSHVAESKVTAAREGVAEVIARLDQENE